MNQKEKSQATRQKIIEVAARLFLEKGFEKTSMRDIVEGLGMSKGAIYHQFTSKEEIIQEVYRMQEELNMQQIERLGDQFKGMTGKEKLKKILEDSLQYQEGQQAEDNVTAFMKSSEYVVKYMQDNVSKNAPFIAKCIEEGNRDGSLSCAYPNEMAEAFMLLFNVWCDPTIFEAGEEKVRGKLRFIQSMLASGGVDILEDQLIEKLIEMI